MAKFCKWALLVLSAAICIYFFTTGVYLFISVLIDAFGRPHIRYPLRYEVVSKPISFLVSAVSVWAILKENTFLSSIEKKYKAVGIVISGYMALLLSLFMLPLLLLLTNNDPETLRYWLLLAGIKIDDATHVSSLWAMTADEMYRQLVPTIVNVGLLWGSGCIIMYLGWRLLNRFVTGKCISPIATFGMMTILLMAHVYLSSSPCCAFGKIGEFWGHVPN